MLYNISMERCPQRSKAHGEHGDVILLAGLVGRKQISTQSEKDKRMSGKKSGNKFEKKPANRSAGQSIKSVAKAAARTGAGASAKVTAKAKTVKIVNDSGKPSAVNNVGTVIKLLE